MNVNVSNLLINNLHWDLKKINSLESIGGLTNNNFKLCYNNQNYFVRICSNNILQKNPSNELSILKKSSKLNLCPYPLYFDENNGNMVTPWIYGSMPTEGESNSKYIIKKLIMKLKSFHQLESNIMFNPFNEIRNRIVLCKKHNIILPAFFNILINKLNILESTLCSSQLLGLCHNDLNPSNILLTKNNLFIIDYELSGVNDIFFDLATIAWLINDDNRKTLLKEYFGYYDSKDYDKLIQYLYVVKMLNGTWALLKSLDTSNNYDYTNGANIIFKELLLSL
jgi:thiamine kinase-like enzyme